MVGGQPTIVGPIGDEVMRMNRLAEIESGPNGAGDGEIILGGHADRRSSPIDVTYP